LGSTSGVTAARLVDVATPDEPAGVVIVLHGGASRRRQMRVSPAQLSVLRMIPIARRIARADGRLAVFRLLNSHRGWDTEHTPLHDVEWALAEVAARLGADIPVCLVGHSLGGRGALLSAGSSHVCGVVALAPWVLPSDVVAGAAGTPVVIIHGDADRVASPARAWQVAERLRRETQVAFITVTGGKHAMLRRRDAFDGLAARCAVWMLLGRAEGDTVQRIAAGASALTL
jgi:predicted esterase